MNFSPALSLSKVQMRLALIASGLALWILVSVGVYSTWIHGADHRDFYGIWATSRLLVTNGLPLYTPETNLQSQLLMRGHAIPPGENQQWFLNPAFMVPLFLPYWLIADKEIAASIWVGMSTVMLVGALLLIRDTGVSISRKAMGLLMTSSFVMLMLFMTQPIAVPIFALTGTWWAYSQRRDWLAGAILPAAMIKPEVALFVAGTIMAVAAVRRRWRLFGGLVASSAALFGLSIAFAGWWVERWIERILEYSNSGYGQSTWAPATAISGGLLAVVTLSLIVAALLVIARRDDDTLIALSVPLGLLVLPQTLPYALAVLFLPMSLAWRGSARWGVVAVWLASWLLLIGYAIDNMTWWRWHMIIAPLLALAVVAWASRSDPKASLVETHRVLM